MRTMASMQLQLAEAVKRFNALPPEQQQKERAAQRKSWVIGELMLTHPEMTREEAEELYDRICF